MANGYGCACGYADTATTATMATDIYPAPGFPGSFPSHLPIPSHPILAKPRSTIPSPKSIHGLRHFTARFLLSQSARREATPLRLSLGFAPSETTRAVLVPAPHVLCLPHRCTGDIHHSRRDVPTPRASITHSKPGCSLGWRLGGERWLGV